MGININDKVLVPRTGGYYTEGVVLLINNGKAVVEFPVGDLYRGGKADVNKDTLAHKTVPLTRLGLLRE